MSSPLRKVDAVADQVLAVGRTVVRHQAEALRQVVDLIDRSVEQAVQLVQRCHGNAILSGIGKSGWIGQKLATMAAATGNLGHFMHPAEALHGGLGEMRTQNLGLVLSHSARTDALALVKSLPDGFPETDFSHFHPGGWLGFKLARVEEWMRPLIACRLCDCQATVPQALINGQSVERRSGAILLVHQVGKLAGLCTDRDWVMLLKDQTEHRLDPPIHRVMTCFPVTVRRGTMMNKAIAMSQNQKNQ